MPKEKAKWNEDDMIIIETMTEMREQSRISAYVHFLKASKHIFSSFSFITLNGSEQIIPSIFDQSSYSLGNALYLINLQVQLQLNLTELTKYILSSAFEMMIVDK